MSPKVYVETSVVSYLTARLSRDLIVAAHQQITQEWWQTRQDAFQLFTSQLVINEAESGDSEAAVKRMEVLSDLALLDIRDETTDLVQALLNQGCVPSTAVDDALHIAVAAIHRMDYLLTWNCKHLANAVMRPAIEQVCRDHGYNPSIICTPEELSGG